MNQGLWTVDSACNVSIYDMENGAILKSWKLPGTSSAPASSSSLMTTVVSSVGIFGDWLVCQPSHSHVVYFWHHYLLGGKRKGDEMGIGTISSKVSYFSIYIPGIRALV